MAKGNKSVWISQSSDMAKSGLPKSIRKFARKEKARLRREFMADQQAEEKIRELVVKIAGQYNKTRVEKK